MKKQAIFLMGPTASGKTSLAIQLVKYLPVDIISVDSAMVFRGLDIGTGKPTASELACAPHQLIDICDPAQAYSSAQFCIDASLAMQNSWQQNRIPLLVGGTMLYFKALQDGLAILPSADYELRKILTVQAQELGWPVMHAKLVELDPISAQRLSVNDSQRIQRALEINILTGKSLNENYQQQKKMVLDYHLSSFAIIPERAGLHLAIEKRFINMLDLGLIKEVEGLYKHGNLDLDMPSMRSVGYRQVWSYLNNAIDYNTMREQAIAATRQLAKRQYTWLRSWPAITNLDAANDLSLEIILKSIALS